MSARPPLDLEGKRRALTALRDVLRNERATLGRRPQDLRRQLAARLEALPPELAGQLCWDLPDDEGGSASTTRRWASTPRLVPRRPIGDRTGQLWVAGVEAKEVWFDADGRIRTRAGGVLQAWHDDGREDPRPLRRPPEPRRLDLGPQADASHARAFPWCGAAEDGETWLARRRLTEYSERDARFDYRVWRAEQPQVLDHLVADADGDGAPLRDAALSRDGRRCAVIHDDGRVELRTLATGDVKVLEHPDALDAQFSADGKVLVTLAADGLRTWNGRRGRPLAEHSAKLSIVGYEQRHCITPDGDWVVGWRMGARDLRELCWWPARGGDPAVATIAGKHGDTVLDASADVAVLSRLAAQVTMLVVDRAGRVVAEWSLPGSTLRSAALRGDRLITAEDQLRAWDLGALKRSATARRGTPVLELREPATSLIDRAGTAVAGGNDEAAVVLPDPVSAPPTGHPLGVPSVLADGRVVVRGMPGSEMRWAPGGRGWSLAAPAVEHLAHATAIACGHDGTRLAVAWTSGRVAVFAAPSGDVVAKCDVPPTGSRMRALAFTPDGGLLGSTARGELLRWDVSGALAAQRLPETRAPGRLVAVDHHLLLFHRHSDTAVVLDTEDLADDQEIGSVEMALGSGRFAVIVGTDGNATALDLRSGDPRPLSAEGVMGGAPAPVGPLATLATGGDAPSTLVALDGSRPPAPLPVSGYVTWREDGRALLVSSATSVARVDVDTLAVVWELDRPAGGRRVRGVLYAGGTVALVGPDGVSVHADDDRREVARRLDLAGARSARGSAPAVLLDGAVHVVAGPRAGAVIPAEGEEPFVESVGETLVAFRRASVTLHPTLGDPVCLEERERAAAAWDEAGDVRLSAGRGGDVVALDPQGRERWRLAPAGRVTRVVARPDGSALVIRSAGAVDVASDGTPTHVMEGRVHATSPSGDAVLADADRYLALHVRHPRGAWHERTLPERRSSFGAAAISDGGGRVVLRASDGTLQLLDIRGERLRSVTLGERGTTAPVALDEAGRRLLAADGTRVVRYDVEDALSSEVTEARARLKAPLLVRSAGDIVSGGSEVLAWTADGTEPRRLWERRVGFAADHRGSTLLVAAEKELRLIEDDGQEPPWTAAVKATSHGRPPVAAVDPFGRWAYAIVWGTFHRIDLRSAAPQHEAVAADAMFKPGAGAVSGDGRHLVLTEDEMGFERRLAVYRVPGFEPVVSRLSIGWGTEQPACSSDGRLVATTDGVFELSTLEPLLDLKVESWQPLPGGGFAGIHRRVLVVTVNGEVHEVARLSGDSLYGDSLAVLADGRLLAVGLGARVIVIDLETGEELASVSVGSRVTAVAAHPSEATVLAATHGGRLHVLDLQAIAFGPLWTSAVRWENESRLMVDCPACWSTGEASDDALGGTLSCANGDCGRELAVEPVALEPDGPRVQPVAGA